MDQSPRTTITTTAQPTKLRWWPSPQDYNEAIQNPHHVLSDEELKNATVAIDNLGLPRPTTGAFASVYRVSTSDRGIALRCFLRDIAGQQERYELISKFVQNDDLPYTVSFDFIKDGIKVNGRWHPILKMDWVDGVTLDSFVRAHHSDSAKIAQLSETFMQMCRDLQDAGIAHGDLQHGNILICNDELRLVDYDGMFVPQMHGLQSNELGHPNYQHPQRSGEHFGAYLDNFSAWVIYGSLRCLALDPSLFEVLNAGDDCLLFRKGDFADPLHSDAFFSLENHENLHVVSIAQFIRSLLLEEPHEVPFLTRQPPMPPYLPPVMKRTEPVPGVHKAPTVRIKQSAADKPVVPKHEIEPVLTKQLMRNVRLNRIAYGHSPWFWQLLAIFNPFTWMIFLSNNQSIMALGVLAFVFLELQIWWRALRHMGLVQCGTPVVGTVICKTKEQTRFINASYTCFFLYYGFARHGGYEESCMQVTEAIYDQAKRGEAVTVLHSEANYPDSVIYKYALYLATY